MFNTELESEIIPNEHYPDHFRFKEDKPCKFLDLETKRCGIYDSRPQVCRNYPLMMIGSEDRARNIINLRYNCNYATRLILDKSMILFDEAVKRLD
jgi:Fe-S-cluster containining protein